MPLRNRQGLSTRFFATPLLLILGLLAAHWMLSEWDALPRLISSTFASIH